MVLLIANALLSMHRSLVLFIVWTLKHGTTHSECITVDASQPGSIHTVVWTLKPGSTDREFIPAWFIHTYAS
jgi:hypothetical protein